MPNWNEVLHEIKKCQDEHASKSRNAIDIIRRKYLTKLHKHTNRNVIAYYSGFLSKPNIEQAQIVDEDKNGFMMAIHNLNREQGLDLILHTPGGNIAATESLVDYLHKIFGNNIRAIVPQIAMSAGTMLACSCSTILMAKHSNLGPIDPHLRGLPAHGVVQEFKRAYNEIKQDPAKALIWQHILTKYHPTFLSQCENAIEWSKSFVLNELKKVMFSGEADAKSKASDIVNKLSDYTSNKSHSRHISAEECKEIGLKVTNIEDDQELQDIILTVHHSYMHSLTNTAAFKMIENHLGVAFVKQQIQEVIQIPR